MENERISYARAKLLELVEKRELKSWCVERGLPHTTIYKIAVGSNKPTFAVIASLVPYIPPAEWAYMTDEEIPYEAKVLPEWNPDDTSSFIKAHKGEYLSIAEKYGLTAANAKNIFINRRANVTLLQIRAMAKDVNPEEFFTFGETEDILFYPERGDIVTINGKTVLVISRHDVNKENNCFVGFAMEESGSAGIEVNGEKTKGIVALHGISSWTYIRKSPVLVDKASDECVKKVLSELRKIVD